MRQLIRELWGIVARSIEGEASAEAGGVAITAALTLEDSLAWFDGHVAAVPDRLRSVLAEHGRDSVHFDRISEAVDAIKALVSTASDHGIDVPGTAAEVDARLSRAMQPMGRFTRSIGQRIAFPGSGWCTEAEVRAAEASFDRDRLAAARRRVVDAELATDTADQLRRMLDALDRIVDRPEYRPRVAAWVSQLADLLDAHRVVVSTAWLPGDTADRLTARAQRALAALGEPAEHRNAKNSRLLVQIVEAIEWIDRLKPLEEATEQQLRAAIIAASDESADNASRAEARLHAIHELLHIMTARRAIDRQRLPTMRDRARDAFGDAYDEVEQAAAAILADANPRRATGPGLTRRLDRLRRLQAHVRRLNATPRWIDQMAQLNRHAGDGFARQLRLLAEGLIDPERHARAAAALADLERRMAWTPRLPNESLLDGHEAPAEQAELHATDRKPDRGEEADAPGRADWPGRQHAERIRLHLTVARSQWAAAWSAGIDPAGPGARLDLLRRLLIAGGRVRELGPKPPPVERLSQWPAWAAARQPIARLHGRLGPVIEQATEAAADGDWQTLTRRLAAVERDLAPVWLAHRLHRKLEALIDGTEKSTLARFAAYRSPPPRRAYLQAHRGDLGWLVLTLEAWHALPDDVGRTVGPAMLDRAATYADRVIEAIDGRAETAPPRPASPLSDVDL